MLFTDRLHPRDKFLVCDIARIYLAMSIINCSLQGGVEEN
jgi:hypothetical protein